MKITGIHTDGVHIEFFNSMWSGKETIKVNGEIVSAKHSFFGASHYFQVLDADGRPIDFELRTGFNGYGVTVDLFRNGEPLLESGGRSCYRGHKKHKEPTVDSPFV